MATADPCAESFFSRLVKGNALLCSQKDSLVSSGQSEIQSVADNASKYYGANSTAAQVAQQAANGQKEQVVDDVNQISDIIGDSSIFSPLVNADCDGFDLSIVGFGCIKKWYIGAALGVVLLVILGPYILPYFFPRK